MMTWHQYSLKRKHTSFFYRRVWNSRWLDYLTSLNLYCDTICYDIPLMTLPTVSGQVTAWPGPAATLPESFGPDRLIAMALRSAYIFQLMTLFKPFFDIRGTQNISPLHHLLPQNTLQRLVQLDRNLNFGLTIVTAQIVYHPTLIDDGAKFRPERS